MSDTRNVEERISQWLQEDAMRHFPDHLLRATYEQTRKSKQQGGWRGLLVGLQVHRFGPALASMAIVVVAVALAIGLYVNRPSYIGPQPTPSPIPTPAPTPDPWAAFIGTFVSDPGDADQGVQTMTVERADVDSVDVVIVDTIASVCQLTPSTMTGTGHVEDLARLVIPTPDYTCDDGSTPHLINGDPTPVNEVFRNLTYTLDEATGNILILPAEEGQEPEVWVRQADPQTTPGPSPSANASAGPSPEPTTAAAGLWWPQSSLDEAREAQDLADAGDPDYEWQVDPDLVDGEVPWGSEVLHRFATERLGWEAFNNPDGWASGGPGNYTELTFYRCAPDQTNPLYPSDPEGRGCAPTIDDLRYETVTVTLEQPIRRDPSGIWVVTDWRTLQSAESVSVFEHLYPDFSVKQLQQVAPPSDVEATTLVESFLEARIAGEGAEQYVHRHPGEDSISNNELVPMLLYGTTDGIPYERYEIDRLGGPEWPTGWIEYRTHLFAQDGTEVVQSFAVIRTEGGELGLVYGYPQTDKFPTTENGQPVPIPYTFLGGDVTFAAEPTWDGNPNPEPTAPSTALYLGNPGHGERLLIAADPLPVETGCQLGSPSADAEGFAQSILSNADFEATNPVAVIVGGHDALQMDIVAAQGATDCEGPYGLVMGQSPDELGQGNHLRLYLLDAPGGSDVLAIAIAAPESEFDRVMAAAAPIVDSIEFHAP